MSIVLELLADGFLLLIFCQMPTSLPPQPHPTGMPPKLGDAQPEGSSSESEAKTTIDPTELLKMAPPPPPLRQQPQIPGAGIGSSLQLDMLPPGIARFPPPPPADMRPPFSAPGIPGQPGHVGLMTPLMPRPPFGPPLAYPSMIRPPLPPGPPPISQEGFIALHTVPQKPSYIKSAASTVVKRPLAQHTPELTAMVSICASAMLLVYSVLFSLIQHFLCKLRGVFQSS